MLQRLKEEPDWVPRCDKCASCMRPNVMIFADDKLEHRLINEQHQRCEAFVRKFEGNMVVVEISAGKVIASICAYVHQYSKRSRCLVHTNPDTELCKQPKLDGWSGEYIPMQPRSMEGLSAICKACEV